MTIPEACITPLTRIHALLTKTEHRDVWPTGRSKLAAKLACERGDINGVRHLADLLEKGAADGDQPEQEREAARELGKELRQLEAGLGKAVIEQTRKSATRPPEETGS